jgi:hypothetical protein
VSRVIVFDLSNQSVGEFDANCDRGWMLYGNPGVDGAGQTAITIPDSVAVQKWLQLGRLILIQRPPLPAWAGVIDTPWKVTLPVQLTLYNAEFLFSLRSPEAPARFTGSVAEIVKQMIRIVNDQEQTYLTLGNVSGETTSREETLDQRSLWDQLVPMLERTGHELVLRPERGADNRLVLYADVGVDLGDDTGFLLDDGGPGKNMRVVGGQINGKIINRVKGVSGQSTSDSQLATDVLENQASQDTYRTRSSIISFRDITQLSALAEYTKVYLAAAKDPYIDLTVEIMDVGNTFANMKPGNRLVAHSSHVYLPGGVLGWRGNVRILAMAYDEDQNTILARLRGRL